MAAPDEVRILVFSVTGGSRHDSVEKGNQTIQGMESRFAEETGAESVTIEVIDSQIGDASGFPSDAQELQQYDAVVWNNTSGSPLDSDQQSAFQQYIRNGGGYVGVHSAATTHQNWTWYGDLVGAYAQSHPDAQEADVAVEDQAHPSTEPLSARWTVTDAWYDYDASPRGNVHVLATVDEDTYDDASMSNGRVDHPIAWCHEFDGGRSWYTGRGHTQESFDEQGFRDHLFRGIMWSAGFVDGDAAGTVWDAYQAVELTTELDQAVSFTVTPDGRIFLVQRPRDVLMIDPETGTTSTALSKNFYSGQEDGGQGIAVDPDFEENGWIYLYYSPTKEDMGNFYKKPFVRLSRFTVEGDQLDPDSEVEILRVHTQREKCCHVGGEIGFDSEGHLYISTGDDTNPHESSGFTPIDERDGRRNFDAQRSAGDTSDLRGSLLRITPHEDGSYSIPEGNLFPEDEYEQEIKEGTVRPEIYNMGLRNPFHFDVDPETDWVYLADYGPDASDWNDDRGPLGIVEYQQIREAGNQGWPYVHGPHPYVDYDFQTGSPATCSTHRVRRTTRRTTTASKNSPRSKRR